MASSPCSTETAVRRHLDADTRNGKSYRESSCSKWGCHLLQRLERGSAYVLHDRALCLPIAAAIGEVGIVVYASGVRTAGIAEESQGIFRCTDPCSSPHCNKRKREGSGQKRRLPPDRTLPAAAAAVARQCAGSAAVRQCRGVASSHPGPWRVGAGCAHRTYQWHRCPGGCSARRR